MRDYVNSSTNIVFLAGGDERAGFGLIGAMFGAVSLCILTVRVFN